MKERPNYAEKILKMEDYQLKRINTGEKKPLSESDRAILAQFDNKPWQPINTRLQCLEIASKLKTADGEAMALKELIGKAEALYEFINKK